MTTSHPANIEPVPNLSRFPTPLSNLSRFLRCRAMLWLGFTRSAGSHIGRSFSDWFGRSFDFQAASWLDGSAFEECPESATDRI